MSSLLNALVQALTFGQAPNLRARERVLRMLSSRPELTPEAWLHELGSHVNKEVALFTFDYFDTRGIPFGRVQPDDDPRADLHLHRILWADWEIDFGEEFERRFGVLPTRKREFSQSRTVRDLLGFLSAVITVDNTSGQSKE